MLFFINKSLSTGKLPHAWKLANLPVVFHAKITSGLFTKREEDPRRRLTLAPYVLTLGTF